VPVSCEETPETASGHHQSCWERHKFTEKGEVALEVEVEAIHEHDARCGLRW